MTTRRQIRQLLTISSLVAVLWATNAVEAMQQSPVRRTAGELLQSRAANAPQVGRTRTRVDYRADSATDVVVLSARGRFDERLAANPGDGPQQVGLHRDLPGPYRRRIDGADMNWTVVPGGRAAAIVIRSPGARAMRLALSPQRLPAGAEVAFFDADTGGSAWGPYDMADLSEPARAARGTHNAKQPRLGREPAEPAPFWSPVIEGEAIGVEVFVPAGTADREVVFALPRISHMVISPYDTRSLSDIGGSGSCEIDVACDPRWSTTALAAAKEIFDTNQGTFLCTGQLLSNTRKDGRPFYSTANHCIESQAVAATATFFWFFERVSCGGADPTTVTQTAGGGDLLNTSSIDTGYDFTLLQLRQSPPGGAALAGWSSSPPSTGSAIAGIHHPAGDLKKISKGTVQGFDVWGSGSPNNSHVEVRWSEGVTEGGSSGSGLYLDGSWPNQPLVGVLSGGSSFCSSPTAPDVYGRLDRFFPDIARWLDPATVANLPEGGRVATNLNQGEWIVRRVTSSTNTAEFTLEVESGDADLYVLEDIAPALDLFECRSWESGTTTDACTIGRASGKKLYVGVFGYRDSSFTLSVSGGDGGDDPVAPVAPTNATAVPVSSSAIDLTWQDRSDNETEFRVERQRQAGSWSEIVRLGAGATTHSDTDLDADIEYCYQIIASNAVGDSPPSPTVCATPTVPGVAPRAPSGVSAAAVSSSAIDVTWIDSSDNEDEFRIDRRRAGGSWSFLTTLGANTTALPDRGLDADTRYCYRVIAANAFGTSPRSDVACASTQAAVARPPATPRRLRVARRYVGGIDLTWKDTANNETGFNIYRKPKRGGAWQRLTSVPANTRSVADTSVVRRQRYCYVVRAANSAGESGTSNRRCTRAR